MMSFFRVVNYSEGNVLMNILVSFITIVISVGVYGWLHSWMASLGFKRWIYERFGKGANRWYRLAYNLIAGLLILPVLALLVFLPDAQLYRVPTPWSLLMTMGQFIAAIAIVIGIMQTGGLAFVGLRQLVSPPTDEMTSQLYVRGMYQWVRHPLYTAGLALIWLSPSMTINTLSLYIGFTIYIIVGAYVEERKLVEEYGDEYLRYQERTPMLIPGFPTVITREGKSGV